MSCHIYTDGSFKKGTIGWGFVVTEQGENIHEESGIITNPKDDLVKIANVGAEIEAVRKAILWSKSQNLDKIHIYHDYQLIKEWSSRRWKSKNYFVQQYNKWFKKQDITIYFHWVGRNSGNKLNKRAHRLANNAVRKYLGEKER